MIGMAVAVQYIKPLLLRQRRKQAAVVVKKKQCRIRLNKNAAVLYKGNFKQNNTPFRLQFLRKILPTAHTVGSFLSGFRNISCIPDTSICDPISGPV